MNCGGCQGIGSHQRLCPQHPNYHPYRRLAVMAEDIGDTIGANDPGIANHAYSLAAQIKKLMWDQPWRQLAEQMNDHHNKKGPQG